MSIIDNIKDLFKKDETSNMFFDKIIKKCELCGCFFVTIESSDSHCDECSDLIQYIYQPHFKATNFEIETYVFFKEAYDKYKKGELDKYILLRLRKKIVDKINAKKEFEKKKEEEEERKKEIEFDEKLKKYLSD